jgi:hypothetical protein
MLSIGLGQPPLFEKKQICRERRGTWRIYSPEPSLGRRLASVVCLLSKQAPKAVLTRLTNF